MGILCFIQIVSQESFTCEWWFNVDCAASESLYSLNDDRLAASSSPQTYNSPAPPRAPPSPPRRPQTPARRPPAPVRSNEGHKTTKAKTLPSRTTIKALPNIPSYGAPAPAPSPSPAQYGAPPTQASYDYYEAPDYYDEYEYDQAAVGGYDAPTSVAPASYGAPNSAPVAPVSNYGVPRDEPISAPVAPVNNYGVPREEPIGASYDASPADTPVEPISTDYGVPSAAPIAPTTDYGVP